MSLDTGRRGDGFDDGGTAGGAAVSDRDKQSRQ